jgi:chemotaxis protein CheC
MNGPTVALTDLERDALTELANIGVSRAAASLRKMVNAQVLLSVPSVDIIGRKSAAALIGERGSNDLVAVREDFTGAFSGRALVIFPQANSLELVRAVIGGQIDADDAKTMEQEALSETGNVILNSCLGTMANMLQQTLKMSLPEVMRGDGQELFELKGTGDSEGAVLFLYINFSIRAHDVRGYIAVLMDLPFIAILKGLIGDFYRRVMADNVDDVV